MRVMAMVGAACAAASAILGWQVLQRSRGARVALSLLAVPLFVTGLAGGGVVSAVVVGRDRDAVVPARPRTGSTGSSERRRREPQRQPEPDRDPFTRDPLLDLPPPTSPPLHPTPYAAAPVAAGPRTTAGRPRQVVLACVLTWLFCGGGLRAAGPHPRRDAGRPRHPHGRAAQAEPGPRRPGRHRDGAAQHRLRHVRGGDGVVARRDRARGPRLAPGPLGRRPG